MMGLTMICIAKGHHLLGSEVKRALKDDMHVHCERCGVGNPIEINSENHVIIQPTGDPEIWVSGSDLGHVDNYK